MNNSRVKKQTKPTIRSKQKNVFHPTNVGLQSTKAAYNGKFNVTSVMAVASHEDNQYELTIDNVNNNNLEKSLESSYELDSDTECSLLSLAQPHSPDSSFLSASSGSSRRKNNSISKGISIEEFLVAPEKSDQLSAIDKLLLKNRVALENQMKQTRSTKPPKEAPVVKKKGGRPRLDKVIGSKIAAKKKPIDENKKPAKTIKPMKCPTKAIKLVKDTAKCDTTKENTPKKRGKPPSNLKATAEKKKAPKKEPSQARKKKLTDTEAKTALKLKKLSKNERQTDLKSFVANASHKTRSFTKVKLRNGKSRIIQENKKSATSPTPPRKYNKRSITSVENTAEVLIDEKVNLPCKRPIKQEPLDEDVAVRRKKRKTTTFDQTPSTVEIAETPQPEVFTVDATAPVENTLPVVTQASTIKEESVKPIKQETKTIEEINVVNKELLSPQSIHLYRDINGEPKQSDVLYVLQDFGSYVKEIEKKTSKPDTATQPSPVAAPQPPKQEIQVIDVPTESEDEFSLQEACTESEDLIDEDITLQCDSDEETGEKQKNPDEVAKQTVQAEPSVVADQPNADTPNTIEQQPVAAENSQQEKSQPSQVEEKEPPKEVIENNIVKESILGALGLEKVNQRDNYTGTLKAVIKVDKGCRRMEMMQKESSNTIEGLQNETVLSFYSKIQNNKSDNISDNTSALDKPVDSVSATMSNGDVFRSKPHDDGLLNSIREANIGTEVTNYNNGAVDLVSNLLTKEKTKAEASLVVPEKSSSFSIHPNRLCSDVCKYCFGKFGSLDTPCHVAQLKNPERQRKILLCEPNLKMDTCLCDACYRYVDRKANKPPAKRNKNIRRSISINQRTVCVIQNCNQFARHMVKRKWLLRISKKIAKLSFDVNKGGTRMRYGLCSQHYYLVDFYTLCGICKKRLNRNHMYSIRSELNDLNEILREDSIPIKLLDNMLLCKLCHYYMSLRLKYGNATKMSPGNRQYYKNFRKKILCYYNVAVSDSEDVVVNGAECSKTETAEPPRPEPTPVEEVNVPKESSETKRNHNNAKKNHNVGIEDIANLLKPLEGDSDKNSARIQVKFGNLNIGKLSNLNIGQNTQTEMKHDKSNDKELPLIADFCFETPCSEPKIWEKCVSTIQFDKGTKKLWQDLQKPYGNQSSFIRHLIMLEKYWRSGSLVLAENADTGAVKYINSVKNRIESLETSSTSVKLPPLKPVASVTPSPPPPQFENVKAKNSDGSAPIRYTPEPPPLLKIDQMNNMSFNQRKTSGLDNGPPIKMVSVSAPTRNTDKLSLSQYKEMMHPQPRTKQLTQVSNGNVHNLGVSLLPKYNSGETFSENSQKLGFTMMQKYPASNPASKTKSSSQMVDYDKQNIGITEMVKKYASTSTSTMPAMRPIQIDSGPHRKPCKVSKYYENYPNMWRKTKEENDICSSSIIAKLPKALTVTAVDEPTIEKIEEKCRWLQAPFLAGEEPSVSVFREISK